MFDTENLTAYADSQADRLIILATAERLGLTPIFAKANMNCSKPVLMLNENGLFLEGLGLSLCGDFSRMISRIQGNKLNSEILVRAAKMKNHDKELTVIDATAGMGEDSLLLAAAGFNVIMFEYNPVIAALLQDTLYRASQISQLSPIINRMKLIKADSITELPKMVGVADVVYLDPMFPSKQKSGLVKKKFQLLEALEVPCADEHKLLEAALASQPKKVVIKRPVKGPFLADVKPGYSITGDGIRYDCIVPNY